MTETIYILLPVHNRREVTLQFVHCLLSQTYTNYVLILIDDGSTDFTAESVCNLLPSVRILQGDGSLWWAGALQKGYDYLRSLLDVNEKDIVFIANDDIEFGKELFIKAIEYLREHPAEMSLAQSWGKHTGVADAGVTVNWRSFTFRQAGEKEEINCLPTRCLFMLAETFFKAGGFCPKLLPHYLSDLEYTMRALKKGIRLSIIPSTEVFFNEKTTGLHCFDGIGLKKYLQWMFSVKNSSNPLLMSNFLLLACPFPWKVINLLRVWRIALRGILKMSFREIWRRKTCIF